MIKKCPTCTISKVKSEFSKNKNYQDGLQSQCRSCQKKHRNELEVKENKKTYNEQWRLNNPEYHPNHHKEYEKHRYNNDPLFKLLKDSKRRIRIALRNNSKSGKTIELLGCSIEFLKSHLQSQFTKGMTWENHGIYGWHIDHIRPCSSFDLSKSEEQRKCFHYSNLQPLWAIDNLKKSNKF